MIPTSNLMANTTTVSPSKSVTARSYFSKPTPRLDGHGRIRRNSVQGSGASASESEDDARKNIPAVPAVNPVRSETVVQNEKQNSTINNVPNSPQIVGKAKRKMMVSESARRLAEARREFQLKHENKPPDRSKLRMYDFIHYNPSTNPMKKKPGSTNTNRSTVRPPVEIQPSRQSQEYIDDPMPTAMPVPQVKVGPDGELILDEKSLVIENTGVKESRAAIASQAVIIEDNDFGNGFYKRRKKTKEWPEWETIKFYKALNIVGTDFLLMQSLFPKRNRQELKIKFKKEERTNRVLVEKALKYSQEFDIDLLKKELDTFETPDKFVPKPSAKENSVKNPPKQTRKRKQASRRIAAMSICEEDADEEIEYNDVDDPPKNKGRLSKSKPKRISKLRNSNEADNEDGSNINSIELEHIERHSKLKKVSTRIDDELEKMFNDDDDDNDISNAKRISMKKEILTESENETTIEIPLTEEFFRSKNNENQVSDISSVEPGSLVIVSKESEHTPGETYVQVYMVSSDMIEGDLTKTVTPVNIDSENLSAITSESTSITPL